jgi:SAM-dependent methyltransferase
VKLEYANKLRKYFLRTQLAIILRLHIIDVYQPIFGNEKIDSLRYSGTINRWVAIQKELGDSVGSALDIGCNNGFFSFSLARKGYICLGIESTRFVYYICNLIKEINSLDNAIFLKAKLEEIIGLLPQFDVTLFLSLFHHFVRLYGFNQATSIVVQLLAKTNRVMFFETGQSNEVCTSWSRYMPDMGSVPKLWIQNYLLGLGVKYVKWLGDFETHLSSIPRSLFAVYIK